MSDTGLTVQEAIESIERDNAPPETVEAPAQAEETEIEAVPTAETSEEPEGEPEGEIAESDETEEAEEAEPASAIEPPRFWDADKKELFRALSPELQAYVVAKEGERDKATSVVIQKASEKAKAIDAETSKLGAISAHLDKLLPTAEQTFESRWKNVDWNKVVDEYGAEAALKLRNDFEREQSTVQQLTAAKAEVDGIQTAKFVSDRFETLKTVAPELTEDGKGPERQLELVKYLSGFGVNPDIIIKRASAQELAIGYKAMLYDRAQAKAKTAATAPKPAPVAKPNVRPTAGVVPGSPQSSKLKILEQRFAKSNSKEDLIALITAQG